jgi:hypothetical protein
MFVERDRLEAIIPGILELLETKPTTGLVEPPGVISKNKAQTSVEFLAMREMSTISGMTLAPFAILSDLNTHYIYHAAANNAVHVTLSPAADRMYANHFIKNMLTNRVRAVNIVLPDRLSPPGEQLAWVPPVVGWVTLGRWGAFLLLSNMHSSAHSLLETELCYIVNVKASSVTVHTKLSARFARSSEISDFQRPL